MCTHLLTYAKFACMQKLEKYAPASDRVQISFCVYANFAYMQIWSCVRKAKFAHVIIWLIMLNKFYNDIVSRLELFSKEFNLT